MDLQCFYKILMMSLLQGCGSSGGYTHYLVDSSLIFEEYTEKSPEAHIIPQGYTPREKINFKFNDGETYSEVDIPVFSTGQRILIQPKKRLSNTDDLGPHVTLPAPSSNDWLHKALDQSYRSNGWAVEEKAKNVSLSQSRKKLEEATRTGEYTLGLQYATGVLQRYPQHPEFLRAAGSLSYLTGDYQNSQKFYEMAQNIEYSPLVESQLRILDEKGAL